MNSSTKPRISVVIPSYNQGAYIEDTILSVLHQDFGDWELIIQDSCSKDQTEEVCRHYAALDPAFDFILKRIKDLLTRSIADLNVPMERMRVFKVPMIISPHRLFSEKYSNCSINITLPMWCPVCTSSLTRRTDRSTVPALSRSEAGIRSAVVGLLAAESLPSEFDIFQNGSRPDRRPTRLDVDMVADTDFGSEWL